MLDITFPAAHGGEAHPEHHGRAAPTLREKAARYGIETLSEPDLVALLLGTGVQGASASIVAQGLLEDVDGLVGLTRLDVSELSLHYGIGAAKAARIVAALELGQRVFRELVEQPRMVLASAEQVAEWARPRLSILEHEELWLLCLDARNGLKSARRIAQGGLHGCSMTPKDLLRPALRAAASAIIVLHNHPSGSPEPSPEDIEMTHHLALAGNVMGIPLLDHVIVTRHRCCSLAELGVIP
jgi:DNA repair protein RadC